jgi:hypothetical protein
MSENELTQETPTEDVWWQHLDYYVRRYEDQLLLVQTLLKQNGDPSQDEICTYYYSLDEMPANWARAVFEQGRNLEDGKSCDFVPPDEYIKMGYYRYQD